jgi:hypothetical protein
VRRQRQVVKLDFEIGDEVKFKNPLAKDTKLLVARIRNLNENGIHCTLDLPTGFAKAGVRISEITFTKRALRAKSSLSQKPKSARRIRSAIQTRSASARPISTDFGGESVRLRVGAYLAASAGCKNSEGEAARARAKARIQQLLSEAHCPTAGVGSEPSWVSGSPGSMGGIRTAWQNTRAAGEYENRTKQQRSQQQPILPKKHETTQRNAWAVQSNGGRSTKCNPTFTKTRTKPDLDLIAQQSGRGISAGRDFSSLSGKVLSNWATGSSPSPSRVRNLQVGPKLKGGSAEQQRVEYSRQAPLEKMQAKGIGPSEMKRQVVTTVHGSATNIRGRRTRKKKQQARTSGAASWGEQQGGSPLAGLRL